MTASTKSRASVKAARGFVAAASLFGRVVELAGTIEGLATLDVDESQAAVVLTAIRSVSREIGAIGDAAKQCCAGGPPLMTASEWLGLSRDDGAISALNEATAAIVDGRAA